MNFLVNENGQYLPQLIEKIVQYKESLLLLITIWLTIWHFINIYSKWNKNNFFAMIYKVIIVPTIVLATIFIAFVINSFFTASGEGLPPIIKYLVDDRAYAIILIVVLIFLYFGYNYIANQNEEIVNFKEAIRTKDRQIEQNAGVLEAKYGEFAESIHINNINKILALAVNKFAMVESCHLYTYNLLRIKNSIDIKVNFLYGAEQEGTCINVIKQNYYSINKEIYSILFKIKRRLLEDEDIDALDEIPELYEKIEESDMHESIKVRLHEVILIILNSLLGDESALSSDELDDIDTYRSGILTSILSNKGYIYEYRRGKDEKQGRVYFVSPIVLDNGYMINICIDGENTNEGKLDEIFEDVVLFIVEEYNKVIGGDRDDKK